MMFFEDVGRSFSAVQQVGLFKHTPIYCICFEIETITTFGHKTSGVLRDLS